MINGCFSRFLQGHLINVPMIGFYYTDGATHRLKQYHIYGIKYSTVANNIGKTF